MKWDNSTGTWLLNQTQTQTGTTACGFAETNRTLTIETIPPQITINRPSTTESYGYHGMNQTINWSKEASISNGNTF